MALGLMAAALLFAANAAAMRVPPPEGQPIRCMFWGFVYLPIPGYRDQDGNCVPGR